MSLKLTSMVEKRGGIIIFRTRIPRPRPFGPGWAPRLHRLGWTMDQTKDPGSHDHALSPPPLHSVDGGNAFTKVPIHRKFFKPRLLRRCVHTCVVVAAAMCIDRETNGVWPLPGSREAIINGRLWLYQRNAGAASKNAYSMDSIQRVVTLAVLSNF